MSQRQILRTKFTQVTLGYGAFVNADASLSLEQSTFQVLRVLVIGAYELNYVWKQSQVGFVKRLLMGKLHIRLKA